MIKAVVIVAGGTGSRFSDALPKQFTKLNGKIILEHTLNKFLSHTHRIVISVSEEYHDLCAHLIQDNISLCSAGSNRQESVFNGLQALLPYKPDYVAIHDAARPFVSEQTIKDSFEVARTYGSAIPMLPLQDALWEIKTPENIYYPADRSVFQTAQTPQTFDFHKIYSAHIQNIDNLSQFPDCASVYQKITTTIHTYPGHKHNIKITTPEDWGYAQFLASLYHM